MNKKYLLIIILIPFLLTGCYDYKELNSIAIVSATEINKIDDEYIIYAQVVNPQAPEKTTNPQAPFIIYTGKGNTIQEAYRNITTEASRYLYPSHLELIIINEKLAKEDVTQVIDFYLRHPALSGEFYLMIGKNDNILEAITPIDAISSSSIKSSVDISNKYLGITNKVTFNDFTNQALNPNLEIIVPSIELLNYKEESQKTESVEKTQTETKYKLSGLSVFKDNKLLGYLTEDESLSYNIINNKIKNAIINYECDKENKKYIAIEVINTSSKISFSKEDKSIKIDISIKANLNEIQCDIDLKDKENIKKINKMYEQDLKEKLTKNISSIKEKYNSDIFGFLDIIYKNDYSYYKTIKDTWSATSFKGLKIEVNPKVKIVEKGNLLEVVNEKNK